MGEQLGHARPRAQHDRPELRVGHIPTRDPDHLGWRATTLDELHKVFVLRDNDVRPARARCGKDRRIVGRQLINRLHMLRVDRVRRTEPPRERRGQLGVDPHDERRGRSRRHGLRRDVGVIQAPGGIQQARCDVVGFQVGEIFENLLPRLPGGQQLEHVDHANSHPANAGSTPTLLGTDGNALEEIRW